MRIIGIDPGTTESAVVLWSEGEIQSHYKLPHQDVLGLLKQLSDDSVTKLAVEMVASYGMPVGREVFETVLWIGRYIECWLTLHPFSTTHLVYRRDVKVYLCGSMKAKDGNIRQAIIDRFGPPGTKKAPGKTYGISGDEWQALAVALTAEHQILNPVQQP